MTKIIFAALYYGCNECGEGNTHFVLIDSLEIVEDFFYIWCPVEEDQTLRLANSLVNGRVIFRTDVLSPGQPDPPISEDLPFNRLEVDTYPYASLGDIFKYWKDVDDCFPGYKCNTCVTEYIPETPPVSDDEN